MLIKGFQHVPSISLCQLLAIGSHRVQIRTALNARETFIVTRRKQINHFIAPLQVARRSSVTPNDVLLRNAAVMDNVPETYPLSSRNGSTAGLRLYMCWPAPSDTLTVVTITLTVWKNLYC